MSDTLRERLLAMHQHLGCELGKMTVLYGETTLLELSILLREAAASLAEQDEALVNARCDGHGDGQAHTIEDVNAGRIDDLIAPRLAREQEALTAERDRLRRELEEAQATTRASERLRAVDAGHYLQENARLREQLAAVQAERDD